MDLGQEDMADFLQIVRLDEGDRVEAPIDHIRLENRLQPLQMMVSLASLKRSEFDQDNRFHSVFIYNKKTFLSLDCR